MIFSISNPSESSNLEKVNPSFIEYRRDDVDP